MQTFPEDATNCFAEMSLKGVQKLNKKTIESKFKVCCESLQTLVDKIRQRLIDGIEPDRRVGAIFLCNSPCRLPGIMTTLLDHCSEIIKNSCSEPKENVDLKISTMLLRNSNIKQIAMVIKHTCNILSKVDLLLLYCSGEKSKSELIQEEAKKQKDNLKILADVIMSYFTATKSCITSFITLLSCRD